MVYNVADYFAVSGLRIASLDIFFPCTFPDGVPFGAIPAAIINDSIDRPFDRPDICRNCIENDGILPTLS